ncbi:haloacid dehalogenase [Alicyclobacillus contaminans]|uniref:HAD-IIA family hydrolase n=1 Tax=Alicyclobacillus contaminans TaxID=392016 RepID=UPI000412D3D6|nr:HAD-IIA family hydrolase [Alicyclobacillus contaminans]GMA52289.1 haloacid dehalogenase [Alicyclobacillus contaminans]
MHHIERRWRLALLDLDGTLYRGDRVIPGAPEFVTRLRKRGIHPVFFTNNATRPPQDVCLKLARFGIAAEPTEVCTSAEAAAWHLSQKLATKGARIAYVGQAGVVDALRAVDLEPVYAGDAAADLDNCEAAVLGLDPDADYRMLARFCDVVQRLAGFVLTNPDVRLPVSGRFLPGNGALGSFVATATGIAPYVAGKPNPDFVRFALARHRVAVEEALIIGDNLATDIACGAAAGLYAIHVRTGVAYEAETAAQWRADETVDSVADLFVE